MQCKSVRLECVELPDWEWELSHSCFQVAMASSRTSTAAFESLAFLATSRAGEERRDEERRGEGRGEGGEGRGEGGEGRGEGGEGRGERGGRGGEKGKGREGRGEGRGAGFITFELTCPPSFVTNSWISTVSKKQGYHFSMALLHTHRAKNVISASEFLTNQKATFRI